MPTCRPRNSVLHSTAHRMPPYKGIIICTLKQNNDTLLAPFLLWSNGTVISAAPGNNNAHQWNSTKVRAQTSQIHVPLTTEMEGVLTTAGVHVDILALLTFPPMRGRTCIFPLELSFTDDTIKHVPHRMTWRLVHLFTGNCILPFRTLYIPESWIRSELPVLWGFPKTNTSKHVIC